MSLRDQSSADHPENDHSSSEVEEEEVVPQVEPAIGEKEVEAEVAQLERPEDLENEPKKPKKSRISTGKRKFSSRSRKTHQEYSILLDILKNTSWMSVRFSGVIVDQKFSPQDLFIPNEEMLRQLEGWVTNQDIHYSKAMYQLLYRLLCESRSMQDLTEDCKAYLRGTQDRTLENWLVRLKPATYLGWKNRLLAKFPMEKMKLTIILSDEMLVLEKRVRAGIQASMVCDKFLELSKTHNIPSIVIPPLLGNAKELAFSGYMTTPDAFVASAEFTETVLQNQLSLKQGSSRPANIPSVEFPVSLPFDHLSQLEQCLFGMKSLYKKLHMAYEVYDTCKIQMVEDIEVASIDEHSTHTTVRSWIQNQMKDETKKEFPSLKAFSPLVTRIVNAIGVHFNTPVAGKHPIQIKFKQNAPLSGKRVLVPKKDGETTLSRLESKIQETTHRLEVMRNQLQRQNLAKKLRESELEHSMAD
jgi:hypothetical protein